MDPLDNLSGYRLSNISGHLRLTGALYECDTIAVTEL